MTASACVQTGEPPVPPSLGADELAPNAADDPELYHGMPVNVQVVGRRFHEEQVLAITEYLDKLVRGAEVATSHKL